MDVGVIGVGVMGKNHARVYSEMKAVSSLSLYDINTAGAENVAQATGAQVCKSIGRLLKKVDAVSICVPTQFHYDMANQVLQKGVNFLVEKPICLTFAEGEELLGAIPEDFVAGVGHIERFNPVVTEIRRIMRKPLYIEAKRHNPTSARITGSSVVEDLMIHDIDILFNLLFPQSVRIRGAGNDDISSALFTLNGMTGYLSASRKASKKIRTIYIEEEDCTIEGDFMSQEVYIHRKPNQYSQENERYLQENIIEKVMVNKVEPLRVELAKFLECVKTGKPFPVTPEQAVTNLRICEIIRNGSRKGRGTESFYLARSRRTPTAPMVKSLTA
jgi:predicted dehydrogenase